MDDADQRDPARAEARVQATIQARALLRQARTAALATLDRAAGAPLATLVAVATDADGAPLFLFSNLSQHTKNLSADPRASVLLTGPAGRGDPLNRPRLTLSGAIALCAEPRARRRYIVRNPKAKLYAGFADFAIYRLTVEAVHFNGGFARAMALTPADLLTPLAGAEALMAAEATLLAKVDPRFARLPGGLQGQAGRIRGKWRAIGLDPDGLDLACGASVARLEFDQPVRDPAAWLAAFERRLSETQK